MKQIVVNFELNMLLSSLRQDRNRQNNRHDYYDCIILSTISAQWQKYFPQNNIKLIFHFPTWGQTMKPIYIEAGGLWYPLATLFTQVTGMGHGSGSASHDEQSLFHQAVTLAQ